jgi:hypothetical protein
LGTWGGGGRDGRSDGQGCKRTGAHGRGRTEQGRRWALQEEQGDEEKLGPALRRKKEEQRCRAAHDDLRWVLYGHRG